MLPRSIHKSVRLFSLAALVAVLAVSLLPVQAAQADVFTSDLAIQFLSAPRAARACDEFKARFRVTNLGPDTASGIFVSIGTPDALTYFDLIGVPASLAPGESVIVTAIIKVVAFYPGSSRNGWVDADVSADPYPDDGSDPDWSNNGVTRRVRLIGPYQTTYCP
jgi:hypothetical protein